MYAWRQHQHFSIVERGNAIIQLLAFKIDNRQWQHFHTSRMIRSIRSALGRELWVFWASTESIQASELMEWRVCLHMTREEHISIFIIILNLKIYTEWVSELLYTTNIHMLEWANKRMRNIYYNKNVCMLTNCLAYSFINAHMMLVQCSFCVHCAWIVWMDVSLQCIDWCVFPSANAIR